MFKKILIGLILIVAILAGVIAMQPGEFNISRSAKMAAPPAAPFEQVNDFHKWQAWSPWDKIDPAMKRTYEGPESGVGAIYRWAGNSEVGEGNMTITESKPNDLIKIKLVFIKPMEGVSDTEFTFKPEGNDTVVTWNMAGKNNFVGKAFCLFMGMDKMIGEKFEEGLAEMKKIVEKKS